MLAALEAGAARRRALADVVEDLDDDGRTVLRLSLRGVAATPQNELLRASATGDLTTAEQLGGRSRRNCLISRHRAQWAGSK